MYNIRMTETLHIDSIAYRGDGVARAADGRVWFVPGVCDGETVLAEAVDIKKSFVRGKLLEVQGGASEARLPGDVLNVPGCVYAHATYEAEIRWKNAQLLSFLAGAAKIPDAAEILQESFASPKHLNYRNKITLHYAPPRTLGYYGDDNVSVVDIPQCPLAVPEINSELAEYRRDPAFWRWAAKEGGVVLRWTKKDGVTVVDKNGPAAPFLTEQLPALGDLYVPATGFFQVNPEVCDALVRHVAALAAARRPSAILDLYCGVGVFGLAAARACAARPGVAGCDTGGDVIRAANMNARQLGFGAGANFRQTSAKGMLRDLSPDGTFTIVDPPRAGLEPEVARALAQKPPRTLVYLSCEPSTLTRDLRILLDTGRYRAVSARLFDMFPRTAHFETCVELEKI